MLKRIKYAKEINYMLAGMGEIHRNNLKDQLEKEGIENKFMGGLLNEATTKNKRIEANAEKEDMH